MPTLTLAVTAGDVDAELLRSVVDSTVISRVILLGRDRSSELPAESNRFQTIDADVFSGGGLSRLLAAVETDYLLCVLPGHVRIDDRGLSRLLAVGEDSGAGLVYSDFKHEVEGTLIEQPLIDYQAGSIRDN